MDLFLIKTMFLDSYNCFGVNIMEKEKEQWGGLCIFMQNKRKSES